MWGVLVELKAAPAEATAANEWSLAGRVEAKPRPFGRHKPSTGRLVSGLSPGARPSSGPAALYAAARAGCRFAVRALFLSMLLSRWWRLAHIQAESLRDSSGNAFILNLRDALVVKLAAAFMSRPYGILLPSKTTKLRLKSYSMKRSRTAPRRLVRI